MPLYVGLCKTNSSNTEPGESLWVMKCSHCCPQDQNSRGSNKIFSSLIHLTEQFQLLSCVVLRKLERLEKGQLAELRKTQMERSVGGSCSANCRQAAALAGTVQAAVSLLSLVTATSARRNMEGKN